MSGYAGFLKLLDATAFKSLYANTTGGAPLWTVKSVSPRFQKVYHMPSGCILKHCCTFCADLLENADHRQAPRRRVPLIFCLSSMRVRCPAHRSWPLMSKASMPSISQRSSTGVFGILSFQEMPQTFRRHLRWNRSSLFHMTAVPGPRRGWLAQLFSIHQCLC